RRLADQTIGTALVDVERVFDPPLRQLRDADPDRDLVAQLRGRSKPRLDRRPRHEDAQLVEESRAVAAETEKQLLFRVLEVPEKDAEPDDAGRVGVGPHDAEIDVMKEWTRGHTAGDFNMWGSAPHPGAPARRPANQARHATATAAITSTR